MKMINPNIPEPYCYETDYRKIPREYLNSNIPQGRGFIKWQAFKTMPEQFEQLEQYIQDQNKIDMPMLSDEQVQILNNKLNDSIENNEFINLDYFQNGYIFSIQGYVKNIDTIEKYLIIGNERGNETKKISLFSLVDIK